MPGKTSGVELSENPTEAGVVMWPQPAMLAGTRGLAAPPGAGPGESQAGVQGGVCLRPCQRL